MVSQTYSSASERINDAREEEKNVEIALEKLIKIASKLDAKQIATDFEKVKKCLKSEVFQIIVAGRFKGGKSTFLNALLGPSTCQVSSLIAEQGPLPVDTLPCTAVLTRINYSETPSVRVWHFDETWDDRSFDWYLNEAKIKAEKEEHKDFFKDIREFELYYPAELCQSGVTAIDSPGTEEDAKRTEIASLGARESDAAIVLYPSHSFGGEREIGFAEEIMDSGTRVFTVINLWDDGKPIDLERLKGFVWNRLITDLDGPKYEGQDFSSADIYLINAYKALEGKFKHNPKVVAESGLAEFEKTLGNFLINGKYKAHIDNVIGQAKFHAKSLEKQIDQRICNLKHEQQNLAQDTREIELKLESIRNRQDKLPNIIHKAQERSQQALEVSFSEMMVELQKDLPARLKKRHLKSLEGLGGMINTFRKKKIVNEAMQICQEEVESAIKTWSNNPPDQAGVRQTLKPKLAELRDDISRQVEKMEKDFSDIQFQLTGWHPTGGEAGSPTSWVERVVGIGLGVLLSDVGLAIGGASGWRGLAGTLGGYTLGAIGIATLGALGAVVAWPVALVTVFISGLIGGRIGERWGLENQIWEKVLEEVNPHFPEWTREITPKIYMEVTKIFKKIEKNIMQEVGSLISGQEQHIRQELKEKSLSNEEKQDLLIGYEQDKQQINTQLDLLQDVRCELAQKFD